MCWESGEEGKGEGRREEQEERTWKGKHLVEMFPSLGNDEREVGWSPWCSKMAVTSYRHRHDSPRQVTPVVEQHLAALLSMLGWD